MQTDANTTPTNQSHATARAGQEDSRHVVLTEMLAFFVILVFKKRITCVFSKA
jgi:hypothetical protein